MKLIDADSIPWDVDGVGETPVITKEEINAMPTVEAIPIEWIEKRRMTEINYNSQYCAYRLPCGICTRTNSYCPLFSGTIDVAWTTESTNVTVNPVTERKEK